MWVGPEGPGKMAGSSRDDSMAGLHQIEADIMLCERFLNMDARESQEASGAAGTGGGGRGGDSDRGPAASAGGPKPADGSKLSQQRRKEILDRLLAERSASKKGATASASQARPGPSGRREAGPAGGETREQLVQRLIAEKRMREARDEGGEAQQRAYGAAAPAAKHAAADPRSVRHAWAESSPDTDSLDNDPRMGLRSGKDVQKGVQYHTDTQSAAAQRRPRPASAPRQRMTSDGRVLGAQDSNDSSDTASNRGRTPRDGSSRPQSARSGSVPRERPGVTRPRSPNFSKAPNMHSKDRITRQMEAEMREQLTFKPQISQNPQREGEARYSGERVEYLAQSKKAVWEARERAKLQREEEEQKNMCSFKPKIAAKSRASPSKVPVEVRLLHTANNKQALRQRAKRHLEEQELISTCNGNTFRPKINEASRLLDRNSRPLHERVGQVQRDRQQKRHEAKLKLEQDADLTFKPAINDKSLRIAERVYSEMRVSGDLTERLLAQQHMSMDKRLSKLAAIEQERQQHERFQPQINRNSEKILEHSEKFAGKDFFDRQAETLERKMLLAHKSSLEEHSFKPEIGKAASMLAEELEGETTEDRLQRLAYRDKDHILSSRETIKEQYYSQFNFKPEINPISKELGQAHSIEELHKDSARKQRFEMLMRAKEQALDQECTFKPKVSKSYTRTTGYGDASFTSDNGLSQPSFNLVLPTLHALSLPPPPRPPSVPCACFDFLFAAVHRRQETAPRARGLGS